MARDDVKDPFDLQAALVKAIGARTSSPCEVEALKLIAGGASQEAWALDLVVRAGVFQGSHQLVLRRDMGGALSSAVLSRDREFAVLQAVFQAGVLVPRPYWFIDAEELGRDGRHAFLMQRLSGETIGRRIVRDPALTEARAALSGDMGRELAAIHAVDPDANGLTFLRSVTNASSPAGVAIERLLVDLDALDEPHPAVELGIRWLIRNDPGQSETVLLHGDYRIGNMVVGPDGLRGVLDWESAHVGDPHSDLAWPSVRAWRFGSDKLEFGGISSREPFISAYESASGRRVDRFRVFYWEVLGNVRWAVGALGQARRHLLGQERSVELAALGRIAAEMEHETLMLIGEHAHGHRHA
jgi:aminoglycoside phosphotransferase (APT) family kinase protein